MFSTCAPWLYYLVWFGVGGLIRLAFDFVITPQAPVKERRIYAVVTALLVFAFYETWR